MLYIKPKRYASLGVIIAAQSPEEINPFAENFLRDIVIQP